jgi:hypothetical protein
MNQKKMIGQKNYREKTVFCMGKQDFNHFLQFSQLCRPLFFNQTFSKMSSPHPQNLITCKAG